MSSSTAPPNRTILCAAPRVSATEQMSSQETIRHMPRYFTCYMLQFWKAVLDSRTC